MAVFAIYNLKYSSLSLFLIYSHRCPHGQLICQNCVLALSRRSSNIQEEVPAHANMAVTSSCTFSSLSAQTAHMPELRSGIVATLLEYTRTSPSPCKHGCHFFLYILIAVRAKKERRQINPAIALFKNMREKKCFLYSIIIQHTL